MSSVKKRRILILGGGFAGIECANKLESLLKNDSSIELVMVSEDNFLLFTPMLPQVASGMIETRHIIMPTRSILKKTIFYEGRIRDIDPHGKMVTLWGTQEKRGVSLHYDYLVIALGSQTNFFGLADVEKNAHTMKTLNDAVMVRNRIIDMLEQAENEADPNLKKSLLTFVVVGGGFAGIETAGEIHDLLFDSRKYYPHVQKDEIKVIVIEALPRILPGFHDKLAKFAQDQLEKRGIEILLKTAVTGFNGEEVKTKTLDEASKNGIDDSKVRGINARTLIWTAGVTPVNTVKRSVFKTERGLIKVEPTLQLDDFAGVFAIGDCAYFVNPETGKPYAPTAQLAEAMAETAAKNLYSLIYGKDLESFEYQPKGQMAIIGKRTGIASIFGMNISGLWAWVLWRNVYLSKIPTLEKKFRVLLDWTADLFFDRDISRLKVLKREPEKEYKVLDEVDDVW